MAGHPVDRHVGERLRQRRMLCGMSQERLAAELGVSFQQVQKYEKGSNRMGASRLFDVARVLSVPVGYFFEDMAKDVVRNSRVRVQGREPEDASGGFDHRSTFARLETLKLVRAYYAIQDETIRKRLLAMIRAIGGEGMQERED